MKKQLTQQQNEWLHSVLEYGAKCDIVNGVVNVKGTIVANDTRPNYLTSIPVQFGEVSGSFFISRNNLTSLKGCPHTVGGKFTCYNNQLTSLDYFPQHFKGAEVTGNPFILNDKLFEDLVKLDGKNKIDDYFALLEELKEQIPIQFGVTNGEIIEEIWESYEKIFTRR